MQNKILDKMTLLQELVHLEEEGKDFGFEWPNQEIIIEGAISECHEIQEAIKNQESSNRVQEEIGDLIHAAVSLCRFSGYDVEETMAKVNLKFRTRMDKVKLLAKEKGLQDLHGQSIKFKMELWRQAKGDFLNK